MRKLIRVAWNVVVLLAVVGAASAHDGGFDRPGPQPAPLLMSRAEPTAAGKMRKVEIRLVDALSGDTLDGLIRVRESKGDLVHLRGLLPRTTGLTEGSLGEAAFGHMDSWSVLVGRQTVALPTGPLTVEAFSGLEWAAAEMTLDPDAKSVAIPLRRFYDRTESGFLSGNVHLHLQQISPKRAEQYLTEVARADGCDLVFLSYLERAEADRHYTSNRFTADDLARFSAGSGSLFGWGEEYRHNFPGQPGYGHVMLLDTAELILPASLGADIMKTGNDDGTLRPAIVKARAGGATALWCHHTRGLEDIPNWVKGILDGQTIFDQGSTGRYEEGLYRYLDIGLHVPIATGTDWFIRDMAMTYVQAPRPPATDSWLAALRAGRTFITNGPLLTLTVNGGGPGETVDLTNAGTVQIEASAVGRDDFGSVEVVVNGEVAKQAESISNEGYHSAEATFELPVGEPVWVALRVPFYEGTYDKPAATPVHFNAYGRPIFAHTSPVYIKVGGKGVFNPEAAEDLIAELDESKRIISETGDYSNNTERDAVLAIYDEAIATLNDKLSRK